MGAFLSTPVFISKSQRTVTFGKHIVPFHKKMTGKYVSKLNDKCYVDGFQLVEGKWKITVMSCLYLLLGKLKERRKSRR